MDIKTTILKNGLRIITANRPETESVSLGFWVNTGSAFEQLEENGVSHFIEHMVFKGTKNRTSLQISEEIENVGGQSNAYTSRETTAFYAQVLKGDVKIALDVISDLILNPTFPAEEMIKEKDVVIQEIKQCADSPYSVIFDLFQKDAFPNQALGRTILGPEEGIRAMTAEKMYDYMNNHYAAENIVFVAVGNLNHEEISKMVEEKFSDFRAKTNFVIPEQKYIGGQTIQKKDLEQAHMVLGFKGYKTTHENFMPMMVLSSILGDGSSSRLFQEIREKRGLVYTIYTFADCHSQDGIFGIYAGTSGEELKNLMSVLTDELKKIQNEPVFEKELKRAKAQLKADILMSLERSFATASLIARHTLTYGRVLTTEEIVAKIEAVSPKNIISVAKEIFSSNPTYSLLGKFGEYVEYDDLKKALKY